MKTIISLRAIVRIALLFAAAGGTQTLCGQALSAVREHDLTAVREFDLNVTRQPLTTALGLLSHQMGLSVSYFAADGVGQSDPLVGPLEGRYTVDSALRAVLRESDLTYKQVNDRVIVVMAKPAAMRLTSLNVTPFSLAMAPRESRRAATSAQTGAGNARSERTVEEVIVTAQKRKERLQDVPVPVSVLQASSLVETNQVGLKEYFARVPGLNFTGGNKNDAQLSIRGINGALNPTVGITVDDVPFGSSLFRSGGGLIPDLDPNDLERIEILRGPQGTLYGVNSLGGLVKYVTVDPTSDALRGHLQTGLSSVSNGHELGYSVRGGINVPISEQFAVRASAFTRMDPGYIDNPALSERDVNEVEAAGGLISAMYRPTEAWSAKLTALYQQKDADGVSRIDPTLGDLQQTYIRGAGWAKIQRGALSGTVSGLWGEVEFTSLTGYSENRYRDSIDIANAGRIAAANANFGVAGAHYTEDYDANKFSQEFRLITPLGETFELLLGVFYTHEDFKFPTIEYAANPATGEQVGVLAFYDAKGSYEEYAGFADLTVHFTERFNVQFGGRSSHNEQEFSEVDIGVPPLVAGGRVVIPNSVISESPFTYLVTPQFVVSDDLMLYARSASGYRAGGINPAFARGFPVPPGWKSDKTYTYEVGAKGSMFDHSLSFDATVFYIDWKDLQLNYTNSGVGYTSNGSRAKSQGVELFVEAHPFTGTSVSTSMSYNEAELSESFGASTTRGNVGDRLPFTSKFSGSLSVDQDFPLFGELTGLVGVTAAYVGDRVGVFTGTSGTRQIYPSYTQVDLRAGFEWDTWRINAFMTNAGDKRGLIGGGIGQSNARLLNIIQPRTTGLFISKAF